MFSKDIIQRADAFNRCLYECVSKFTNWQIDGIQRNDVLANRIPKEVIHALFIAFNLIATDRIKTARKEANHCS
jgi:hypothetical protein